MSSPELSLQLGASGGISSVCVTIDRQCLDEARLRRYPLLLAGPKIGDVPNSQVAISMLLVICTAKISCVWEFGCRLDPEMETLILRTSLPTAVGLPFASRY